MRIVLMGNGPFAVPSFDRIVETGHDVIEVVARPPVVNSGKAPPESPVVTWARTRSLSLQMPASINDVSTVEWLKGLHADLFVVCDYGQILSKDALSASRLGGINLHGSLLPRHRGAAPVQWSILAGDSVAGVSVIHMTPALDAGPVLTRAATPITPQEDAGALEQRLSWLGVEPTIEAIRYLESGDSTNPIQQDRAQATKAPRLRKSDGELHLGYPLMWIDRQIRGLQPWPGVFAHVVFPDGKSLRTILHRALPCIFAHNNEWGLSGTLIYGASLASAQQACPALRDVALCAVASDGFLAIESLQPAGKKAMGADEFLRGYGRHVGLRVSVPEGKHPLIETMMGISAMPRESGFTLRSDSEKSI